MKASRTFLAAVAGVGLLSPMAPTSWAAPASQPTSGWADYQTPAPWEDQSNSLHWYVTTPTITADMVGQQAKIQVKAPASIDCDNLGYGYQSAAGWVSVTPVETSCSQRTVTSFLIVDQSMVGSQVALIGWSATVATDAQVDGTVRLGGSNYTVNVEASREGTSKPVGPLTELGTFQDKTVYFSSLNTINEVWVGKKIRYAAPSGEYLHVGMADGYVHVLMAGDGQTVKLWRLDLTTGETEVISIVANSIHEVSGAGFVVFDQSMLALKAYSYSGRLITMQSWRYSHMLGFTDTAYARIGYGMTPSVAELIPVDGSPKRSLFCGGPILTAHLNRETQTIEFTATNGASQFRGQLSATTSTCTKIEA